MAETRCSDESGSTDSVVRAEFDPDDGDVVVAVVDALERVDDSSVGDGSVGDAVLNDAIDPDALRRCLESGGPGTSVSFRFGEYAVMVLAEGKIRVSY